MAWIVVGKKHQLIGLILFDNTIVNIILSSMTIKWVIDIFVEEAVLWAVIILTAVILFFGEILPKSYAIYNAELIILFVAPLIQFFWLINSFINLIQKLVDLMLQIFECKKSMHISDVFL